MAEKIYTIILKVDLECDRCYKKIRKTLCKLQERENIRTIAYDEQNNTVTISGPFDPKRLSKKLCCKACKVIKDIQIVEPKEKEKEKPAEKEKEKPKDAKPAEKEKPKDAKPAEKEKPKDSKPAEPAKEKEKEKPKDSKPAEPAKEKEKEKPKDSKPAEPKEKEKPKDEPKLQVAHMPCPDYPPGYAVGPVCSCGPWYEAHYGGCRCFACGRTYGWVSEGPPHDGNRTCHFFSDEDPTASCTVM